MAYNAESMALTAVPNSARPDNVPPPWDWKSDSYGQEGYTPHNEGFFGDQNNFTPMAPVSTPGSFTAEYGGGSSPAMRDTNIGDYWNGSGYDEIGASQEYQPYQYENNYQVGGNPTDDWAQSNTYAPWSGYSPGGNEATPYELTQMSGYSNEGGRDAVGYGSGMGMGGAWGAGSLGGTLAAPGTMGVPSLMGATAMFNPLTAIPGLGLGAINMKKKKRGTPNLESPSYQGMMFTPEEGFPSYYQPSQETQNQTQQNLYDQPNEFAYQQPEQEGYDYNYTGGMTQPRNLSQQNYVGQQEQEYGSFYNRDKGGIYDTFTV